MLFGRSEYCYSETNQKGLEVSIEFFRISIEDGENKVIFNHYSCIQF